MSYLIKEMPSYLRPRERFMKYGASSLSDSELLSILLRTGINNKSVNELSMDILSKYKINDFANLNYNTLKRIKGIGNVKAITILSAIEFGKRVLSKRDLINQIRCSDDAYYLIKDEMESELQEKFLAIYLDTKMYVIFKKVIFIGTVNGSNVTARDVFREAVKVNATSMIIAHNHPAGSVTPSFQDTYLTNEFIKLGHMLGINLVDHLIIGKNDFYSFRKNNEDMFKCDSK